MLRTIPKQYQSPDHTTSILDAKKQAQSGRVSRQQEPSPPQAALVAPPYGLTPIVDRAARSNPRPLPPPRRVDVFSTVAHTTTDGASRKPEKNVWDLLIDADVNQFQKEQ